MELPQKKTQLPERESEPESRQSRCAAVTENDPRWGIVVAKDASADGSFYYSVRTTGVYCTPSCASRMARPENVQFHTTCAAAEDAGFRPCKRCKPDQVSLSQQRSAMIAGICRQIELTETSMPLATLAQMAGMSSYHFHRLFKAVTGLTPHAYSAACKAKRVRDALYEYQQGNYKLNNYKSNKNKSDKNSSITEAVYAAGYGASSRFYAQSKQILGMTASDYRAGGSNADIKFAIGECRLGAILVACSEHGVCAIYLGEHPDQLLRDLQDSFPAARLVGGNSMFEALVAQVVGYIEAPTLGSEHFQHLPLDIRGTAFQRRVWQALCDIPVGATVSYTEIAQRIGSPNSVRAVASACAANKLAVAIPCHRVVRIDGTLSGYRWGVERKRTLLEMESQTKKIMKKI